MTSPLGNLTLGPREDGRRVTVARTTNETEITITLGLDGSGHTSIDTGIGFYDHLLGSFAHHGLFDLAVSAEGDLQIDEHHTTEDVALVLGAAFAEALGDRAGIQRFGDSSVPMDEALATAIVDIGGRPYAVIDLPFSSERVGALPLQLVEHALESFARTAGCTLHLRGAGRNDHHLAEAAFKALGPCAARRVRTGSATHGRRLHEGIAGMTPMPRIGVADYGAGNLVSIEQALTRVGASVVLVGDAETLATCDALVVPGVGAAGPAMDRLGRHGLVEPILDWLRVDRPFLGICLGLQLLFDSSEEDGARTLGAVTGVTRRLVDAPTLPHIGWNQVDLRRDHSLFDGIADGADFYFVHSYAGAPGSEDIADIVVAETTHGDPFVSVIARAAHDRCPVPPGTKWP